MARAKARSPGPVEKKLVGVADAVITAADLRRDPTLSIPVRSLAKDIGRAKELLKYRWFQKKDWQDEIKRMLSTGLKYELDALANKDFRYLAGLGAQPLTPPMVRPALMRRRNA